jgi:hypothetical protein
MSRWMAKLAQIRAERPPEPAPAPEPDPPPSDPCRTIFRLAPPPGEPEARWRHRVAGVRRFIEEGWHDKAIALGWTLDDLYGVYRPWADTGIQGAAWFIEEDRIMAVTDLSITTCSKRGFMALSSGRILTFGPIWPTPLHPRRSTSWANGPNGPQVAQSCNHNATHAERVDYGTDGLNPCVTA